MRKLIVFNLVSLDGYIADGKGDMSWAKPDAGDGEWHAFVADNVRGGGGLVFGRKTYELMVSFWPTALAQQSFPEVALRMNSAPKLVFSRTLEQSTWNNTTFTKGDPAAEIRKLKESPGVDLAILGSGSIVSQAAQAGLIDEFQMVMNPIALGKGKTMFETLADKLPLKLVRTRVFQNGNVLLCYEPTGARGG